MAKLKFQFLANLAVHVYFVHTIIFFYTGNWYQKLKEKNEMDKCVLFVSKIEIKSIKKLERSLKCYVFSQL